MGIVISRVYSKGKDGRQYVSVLVRQSRRVGKSVVSKPLTILTELPEWLITVVERAVKHGKDAESIAQLSEWTKRMAVKRSASRAVSHSLGPGSLRSRMMPTRC